MPGRQHQPGSTARTGADVRRAAAVLLLLAIAVVGLRAGGAFSTAREPGLLRAGGHILYWAAVAVGIALLLIDLVVIVAWLVWARRGQDTLPLRRRRRNPLWLLALALEVIALARIAAILRQRFAQASRGREAARHAGAAAAGGHLFLPPGSSWPLIAALALAAVVAVALLLPARRARALAEPPPGDPTAPEPLLAAVAAGSVALRDDADPRAAIVSCYAAMENSLAAAGAPPAAADTPAEVLARAGAGGLVRPTAAGTAADTLTRLFRRARYSTHPVTEADRSAAHRSLERLRAHLEGSS